MAAGEKKSTTGPDSRSSLRRRRVPVWSDSSKSGATSPDLTGPSVPWPSRPPSALEAEPHSPHGHQVPRIGWIALDLSAQPFHVRVEGPGVGEVLVPPDPVDAPLAGHHLAGVGHEQGQKVELLAGQFHRPAVDGDLAPAGVEADPAGHQHV